MMNSLLSPVDAPLPARVVLNIRGCQNYCAVSGSVVEFALLLRLHTKLLP